MVKVMDHTEYPESLKSKSWTELMFISKDAREALAALPGGENVSYYADEICYVANEMAKRRK